MVLGQDQIHHPWICSQTHSRLRYAAGHMLKLMGMKIFTISRSKIVYFSLECPMYEYPFYKSMLPYEELPIRFIMIVELIQAYSYVNLFLSSTSNITFLLFLHEIIGTIDSKKLSMICYTIFLILP